MRALRVFDCRLQIADCRLKTSLPNNRGVSICHLQSAICDRRAAFTLLEVILALSLSVILLTALYLTLNLHYNNARSGRELIDEAAILRSVAARISDDINAQLAPMNPLLYSKTNGTTITGNSFGGKSSSSASSQDSSSQNSSTQNSSQSSSTPQSSSPSTSAKGSQTSQSQSSQNSSQNSSNNSSNNNSSNNNSTQTTGPGTVVFNLGVYGDADRLVLTGSWLPKDLTRIQEGQTQTSDLRRVVYWLVREGSKKGLARHEMTAVTGMDAGNLPPDVPDPGSCVIAPEVTESRLEYFDGTEWQTTWDGTTLDTNSSLPIGPPALIAINITITTPSHKSGEKAKETKYRHVVAIPSANITASASP